MNCRKAEQFIPLFVEADLEAAEMEQVKAHLATCEACRVSAAEFAASQSLLHHIAAPEFDETMLTAMRRDVLQSLTPNATCPAFLEWLPPLWTWKTAVAAAAVILLTIGIAIPRRGAENGAGPIANNAKDSVSLATNNAPGKEPERSLRSASQRFQPPMGRKHKAQSGVSASERNPGNDARRQSSPARATDIDNQLAAASVAPSGAGDEAASFPRVDSFTLPPAPQAETAAPNAEQSKPEPEMLRLEFQTADPNIRIIWLTPKEPARANPATEDTK
jgi:hypothetical protein